MSALRSVDVFQLLFEHTPPPYTIQHNRDISDQSQSLKQTTKIKIQTTLSFSSSSSSPSSSAPDASHLAATGTKKCPHCPRPVSPKWITRGNPVEFFYISDCKRLIHAPLLASNGKNTFQDTPPVIILTGQQLSVNGLSHLWRASGPCLQYNRNSGVVHPPWTLNNLPSYALNCKNMYMT